MKYKEKYLEDVGINSKALAIMTIVVICLQPVKPQQFWKENLPRNLSLTQGETYEFQLRNYMNYYDKVKVSKSENIKLELKQGPDLKTRSTPNSI